jgi:hypothetical protein
MINLKEKYKQIVNDKIEKIVSQKTQDIMMFLEDMANGKEDPFVNQRETKKYYVVCAGDCSVVSGVFKNLVEANTGFTFQISNEDETFSILLLNPLLE